MSTVIIHDFVPYVPPAFIPTPTEEDNGKYVGVSDGVYDLSFVDALPGVNASDNDKLLKVVNGKWEKDNFNKYSVGGTSINVIGIATINYTNNAYSISFEPTAGVDYKQVLLDYVAGKIPPPAVRLKGTGAANQVCVPAAFIGSFGNDVNFVYYRRATDGWTAHIFDYIPGLDAWQFIG